MSPFSQEYARIYDLLYKEKDYQGEADLIEKVIDEYRPETKRILDYGCGTGNHIGVLALKGYEIYGLEKNENMLTIARRKLKGKKNIHLYGINRKTVVKPDFIDVCTALFDVISYIATDEEMSNFLSYIKRVLVKGGLFIFDFWYGPGVINLGPEKRRKEYSNGKRKVLRLTSPMLDRENCIVNITHEVIIFEKDKAINRFTDLHHMRYFFKNRLQQFLDNYRFEILKFGTWKDLDTPPTVNDWSALIVAKLMR